MRKQDGFTLIELMIVVAVIGVLAVVALPAYQDYLARSQMVEAMTLAAGAKPAVVDAWWNTGTIPSNNLQAGLADKSMISGSYVAETAVGANGVITATMRMSGVSESIRGKTLSLTPSFPSTHEGSVIWACSSNAANKYLPSSCR